MIVKQRHTDILIHWSRKLVSQRQCADLLLDLITETLQILNILKALCNNHSPTSSAEQQCSAWNNH